MNAGFKDWKNEIAFQWGVDKVEVWFQRFYEFRIGSGLTRCFRSQSHIFTVVFGVYGTLPVPNEVNRCEQHRLGVVM